MVASHDRSCISKVSVDANRKQFTAALRSHRGLVIVGSQTVRQVTKGTAPPEGFGSSLHTPGPRRDWLQSVFYTPGTNVP